ncbi:MAG TPA: hypothetical protein VLE43_03920 [Candidatus Saccharimonadia bacterium]|nr:hypothetical protein [Candidatus Saccharimonadia bacterium]
MERYPTRYNEDDDSGVLGTRNAWEYYFEQPAGITVSQALQLDPLDYRGDVIGRFIGGPEEESSDALAERGRELVKKFVRVRPDVLAKVDAVLPSGVHGDVLGVHVRGTDMRRGYYALHPIPASSLAYVEEATALDRQHTFARVVLACDESETVELFQKQFGDRLLTMNAHRTSAAQHMSERYEWLFESQRELHRYHLGLEVLLDALLLSRCGSLLCGISNVSRAARWFSDDRQSVHYVAPIWRLPAHAGGPSLGRSFLASFPPPFAAPSSDAHVAHVEELHRILELAENAHAETARQLQAVQAELALSVKLDLSESLRAQLEQAARAQERARGELQAAATARKDMKKIAPRLARLEMRVHHIMDWWTWLGWRLRPWKKPSWRHRPLE